MEVTFKLRGETVTIPKYEYDTIFEDKWFISNLVKLNFGSDEELTKTRIEAGAMVETGVMTIMNEASFVSTKS